MVAFGTSRASALLESETIAPVEALAFGTIRFLLGSLDDRHLQSWPQLDLFFA
jgi:hypothetical protein